MADDVTQKIKLDLSDVKREISDAQRQIKLANTEFKKATVAIDDWESTTAGASAKLGQLNTTLDAEKKKLSALNEQYKRVCEASGENSVEAQRLTQRIADQELKIAQTEKSIQKWTTQLEENEKAESQAASGMQKLETAISEQETELAALRKEYANVVLEQGKSSAAAVELGSKISALSSDLAENKTKLDSATHAADEFDNSLDDAGDAAAESKEGFTVLKGALADLVADGIKSAASALKDFAADSQEANSKLQAATGASAEEMEEFSSQMNDLYSQGYGESLEDIGDKMAYVKQMTGEVDPSNIADLTKNAMALEDTFGSDFSETMRGVQSLMNHFGLDAQEAFDLFASGSQAGLDYTDELGDNVSEYAGKFAEAGYSAEEYFQLLENGSNGGAYNLDKVNDAINEATTRLGDGTISESLAMFSDDTQAVFKEWQAGGATQKEVIDAIVKDIQNTTNEEEKMGKAAKAFGTMAEDGGTQFIESLSSVGDSFDNVQGKMDDLADTRYDNVNNQLKTIGRTAQTQILAPLGEKILPKVEEVLDFTIENSEDLIPVVETLGGAFTAAFAISKVQPMITALTTFAATNPIGLIVTALAGLYAANQLAATAAKAEANATYGLSDAQEETINSINELNEAYSETASQRNTNEASINSECDNLTRLASEYDSYLDKNGQIQKGYEDRANFIATTLSESLGIEKSDLETLIEKYGSLSSAVADTIEKKRAEAILDAGTESYTEAIQNQTQAEQDLASAKSDVDAAQKKYNQALAEGESAYETYNTMLQNGSDAASAFYDAHQQEILGVETAKEALDKETAAYAKAQETVTGYNTTIQNYEGLSSAIITGESDKIASALAKQTNNFITAETGTKESLQKQLTSYQTSYDQMAAAVESGSSTITQEQLSEMGNLVTLAQGELDKLSGVATSAGSNTSASLASGMKSGKESVVTASDDVKKAAETQINLASGTDAGKKLVSTFNTAAKNADATSGATAAKTKGQNAISNANGSAGGSKLVSTFNTGARAADATSGAKAAKNKAENTIRSASGSEGGSNFVSGFNKAMYAGLGSVGRAAASLASKALKSLKKALDSHSPSKETQAIGEDFDAGFVIAIENGVKKAAKAAKYLATESMSALSEGMDGADMGLGTTGGIASIASSRVSSGISATGGGSSTTVTNNFYQTNNSPKSLSRLEIYRQTHNLLSLSGGGQ